MSRMQLPTGFANGGASRNRFTHLVACARIWLPALFAVPLLPGGPVVAGTEDVGTGAIVMRLPAVVTEANGLILGVLTLTRAASPGGLSVSLHSSDTSAATAPSSIIVQAGSTSAVFVVTIINDRMIDGPQTTVITAEAPDWAAGSATLEVRDDETLNLSLILPLDLREGDAVRVGEVRLSGILLSNLLVELDSGDTTELEVAPAALINAGQSNVFINLTVMDDVLTDGAQAVRIQASASGFIGTAQTVRVADNDLHHFAFSHVVSPQGAGVPFDLLVTAADVNGERLFGFTNVVLLTAADDTGPLPVTPSSPIQITNGVWLGQVSIDAEARRARLAVGLAGGPTNLSELINVEAPAARQLELATRDLIYDGRSGRLIATVGSDGGANSNRVVWVNPENGQITQSFSIGPEPSRLALSDNGQYLYSVISNGAAIRRLGITNQIADLTFAAGTGVFPELDVRAGEIEVLPGRPHSLVVSRSGPWLIDLAIFDHAVRRPDLGGAWGIIEIAPDGQTVFGGLSPLSRLAVTGSGLTFVNSFQPNNNRNLEGDMKYEAGLIYYGGGAVVDPIQQRVVGVFPGVGSSPSVRPDINLDRVFFLSSADTHWGLSAYDRSTFLPLKSLPLPDVRGSAANLLRWGTNGLAFRTSGGQLYFVQASSLVPTASADLAVSMILPEEVAVAGHDLLYSIVVSNRGPATATEVTLEASVPPALTFLSASLSQGTFTNNGAKLTCYVGFLAPHETAILSIRVKLNIAGWVTPSAYASANELDATPLDNTALHGMSVQLDATSSPPITRLQLLVNDLISQPGRDRLYASLPDTIPVLSNSIVGIDPMTAAIGPVITVGANPGKLAFSDDGQILYFAEDNDRRVRCLKLADLTFGASITITAGHVVADLEVAPGNPRLLAVCSRDKTTPLKTTVLYDDGVPRPQSQNGAAVVEFSDDGLRMFGFDNASTDFTFQKWAVTTDGLSYLDARGSLLFGFGTDFKVSGDIGYATSGAIIAPDRLEVLRALPGVSHINPGIVRPDAASIRHFILSGSTIFAYDPYGLTQLGSAGVPGIVGAPASLTRWGASGLALRTTGGYVIISRGVLVPTNPPVDLSLGLEVEPSAPLVSNRFTQIITVNNLDPSPATGVVTSVRIPPGLVLISASASSGNCVVREDVVTCTTSNLPGGAAVTLNLSLLPVQFGSFETFASVVSTAPDPRPRDNTIRRRISTWFARDGMAARRIDQATAGMVWDPVSQRIYVSVPNRSSVNGNSVMSLDPVTGQFGPPSSPGFEPGPLVVSGDGQFLYVSTEARRNVRRMRLPTLAPDAVFPVDTDGYVPPLILDDWQVMPGEPHSLVLTRHFPSSATPTHLPLTIYDDGIPRPGSAVGLGSRIELPPGGRQIYALEGVTFSRWNIESSGVVFDRAEYDLNTVGFQGRVDMVYDRGFCFVTDGSIIDAENLVRVGRFDGPPTPTWYSVTHQILPWVAGGRVFFLRSPSTGRVILDVYDLNTRLRLNSFILDGIPGTAADFTRWGAGGVGFRTDDAIYLIDGVLPADAQTDLTVRVAISPPGGTIPLGGAFTMRCTITNAGANIASNIVLAYTLPPNLKLISANSSQGACQLEDEKLTCAMGTLASATTASALIQVESTVLGASTNQLIVSSSAVDPQPNNNVARIRTEVLPNALSFSKIAQTAGQARLEFGTLPGRSYWIEHSTDPAGPWVSAGAPVTGDGNNKVWTDTQLPETAAQFYRLRMDP